MIVTQPWTHNLKLMQQTVLLTAIRGPDGIPKYHPCKFLLRWYRRCVLLGALDQNIFTNPHDPRGGSFTGPSYKWDPSQGDPDLWHVEMQKIFDEYLKSLDEIPHHFQLHFMHAVEIVGYKHPDSYIGSWWSYVYNELAKDMHLNPETEKQMDFRLGDSESQWRQNSSKATQD